MNEAAEAPAPRGRQYILERIACMANSLFNIFDNSF